MIRFLESIFYLKFNVFAVFLLMIISGFSVRYVLLNDKKFKKNAKMLASELKKGNIPKGFKDNIGVFFKKIISGHSIENNLIRMVLSFIVAFLVATIFRGFIRNIIIYFIFFSISIWALYYFGIIDSSWKSDQIIGEEMVNWSKSQMYIVKDFLSKVLPSAGAAFLGFGFGLR